MKSGRDEAARGSIPGSSPRPDREHRKPQPTTCYTVVCVKTAVEISEESQELREIGGDVAQPVKTQACGDQRDDCKHDGQPQHGDDSSQEYVRQLKKKGRRSPPGSSAPDPQR